MHSSIPLHVDTCNKTLRKNQSNVLEDNLELCKTALETIERYPEVLKEFKEKIESDRNQIVYNTQTL
ncbi:hypothetical protein BH18THE2_BH18THE2_09110 [soil metagenome]